MNPQGWAQPMAQPAQPLSHSYGQAAGSGRRSSAQHGGVWGGGFGHFGGYPGAEQGSLPSAEAMWPPMRSNGEMATPLTWEGYGYDDYEFDEAPRARGGRGEGESSGGKEKRHKGSKEGAHKKDRGEKEKEEASEPVLKGSYWLLDDPAAQKMVAQEVRNIVEMMLTKLTREAEKEERRVRMAEAKEANKRERVLLREQERREREVEKEVLRMMEGVVRRVEKENERDESGLPFIDYRARETRIPVYKVHGHACVAFLESPLTATSRNLEVETAIRAARQQEQQLQARLKPPKPPTYTWQSPEEKGRPWTVICLQRSVPAP